MIIGSASPAVDPRKKQKKRNPEFDEDIRDEASFGWFLVFLKGLENVRAFAVATRMRASSGVMLALPWASQPGIIWQKNSGHGKVGNGVITTFATRRTCLAIIRREPTFGGRDKECAKASLIWEHDTLQLQQKVPAGFMGSSASH